MFDDMYKKYRVKKVVGIRQCRRAQIQAMILYEVRDPGGIEQVDSVKFQLMIYLSQFQAVFPVSATQVQMRCAPRRLRKISGVYQNEEAVAVRYSTSRRQF